MGTVCPLGNNVRDAWQAMVDGRSGIAPLTQFDTSEFDVRIGGEVRDFRPEELIPGMGLYQKFAYHDAASRIAARTGSGGRSSPPARFTPTTGFDVNRSSSRPNCPRLSSATTKALACALNSLIRSPGKGQIVIGRKRPTRMPLSRASRIACRSREGGVLFRR